MVAASSTVEFVDLTARYGQVVVVDHATLYVNRGERVAITGAGGSGKSTLLRCSVGLHRLMTGSVLVDGAAAVDRDAQERRRRHVVYLPERLPVPRYPVLVGELLASSSAMALAEELARDLGVGRLLDRPLHTLSGDQRQRCAMARAIACVSAHGSVLIADEPTSALDFDGQDQVAQILAALPVTLLVVTHQQALVDRCDRVVEMAGGRLREHVRVS